MEIVYIDDEIIVCVKPPRVLSTDEAGGVPELLRKELGCAEADIRTVHRLDRVVGGLMVLARSASSAAALSRQIRDGSFDKEYVAVVHGMTEQHGFMRDLLIRDRARKMTFVADAPGKGVQEALLEYETLCRYDAMSMVKIKLYTGRTHQIRCQFASRGFPLVGERKYSPANDPCEIALWSHMLGFEHPKTGERLVFTQDPPDIWPWSAAKREK